MRAHLPSAVIAATLSAAPVMAADRAAVPASAVDLAGGRLRGLPDCREGPFRGGGFADRGPVHGDAGGIETGVATGHHAIAFLPWGRDLDGARPGAGDRPRGGFAAGGACTNGNGDRRAACLRAASNLLVPGLAWMAAQWEPGGAARPVPLADPVAGIVAILTGMGSLSLGEPAGERMKLGPSRSDLVAVADPAVDDALRADLDATVAAPGPIEAAAGAGMARDMMPAPDAEARAARIEGGGGAALIRQTRSIERAERALGSPVSPSKGPKPRRARGRRGMRGGARRRRRARGRGCGDPVCGRQLHTRALPVLAPEARVTVTWVETAVPLAGARPSCCAGRSGRSCPCARRWRAGWSSRPGLRRRRCRPDCPRRPRGL